jgi:TonB family protein
LTSRIAAILDSSRARMRAGIRARVTVAMVAVCLIVFLAACHHEQAAYRPGGGVSLPVVISHPEPDYSEEARKAKWQGTVTVSLVVNTAGRPEKITVTKALGLGLDQKAVEAVQKWRFKPGQKNGKPVPVQATLEIHFRLL